MNGEQGIYRDEVIEIFGALADISSGTIAILAIPRGDERDDSEEWTPEEWRAYRAAREASIRALRERVERIKAKLEAKAKAQAGIARRGGRELPFRP